MNKLYFQKAFALFSILFFHNCIFAQTNLATWSFENTPVVTTTAANVTVSNVTLSTGTISYSAGVTGQAISGSSFSTTSALTKYFEFTITPATNFTVSVASIVFSSQVSATGPQNWAIRSNVDAYATNLATGANPAAISADNQMANLGTAVQNKSTAVTFRIYGYNASSSGTFRIDDLKINGTLATTLANVSPSKSAISFGNLGQNSVSSPLSYRVVGSNLTAPVDLVASTGYEICATANGIFASTLSLSPVGGSLDVPVFIKQSTATLGAISGTITHNSTGVTQQTTSLSGTISATLTGFSTIAAARSAASGTAVTVQGYVTVSTQFGGNQIFIQDNTGGISIFSSANLSETYGLQIGDFVQLSGTRSSFNSLAQISPSVFQKDNTPPSVQTPVTITASQMSAYESQLVRIANLPNPAGTTTFAGATNYTFGDAQIRILSSVNAPFSNNLVGSSINTGTSNVTGIAGRFNAVFQLMPRSTTDIENVNSLPFYGNDLNYSTNNTLDVACWNMEWFAYPTSTFGPANKLLQKNNASTVFNTFKFDVLNANEISDKAVLDNIVAAMGPNFTTSCSNEISNTTLATDPNSQRVCFVYNTDVLKNVTATPLMLDVKTNPSAFFPNATLGYPAYPNNDPTNFFASGRLPYAITGDVMINGTTRRMMFVGMHAKANTAPTLTSYERRKLDAQVLKDYLDRDFPNTPFLLMGDYNDDIDVSIYDNMSASSYKNFVDDPARYQFVTGQTSLTGRTQSTVGFNSMIDHIMMSNEMFTAYEAGSARVGTPDFYVPSYGTTTTDHYPVMARFNIANILPVELLFFNAKYFDNQRVTLNWATATEKNAAYFVIERSADGQNFQAIKEIKAAGNSIVRKDYASIDNDPLSISTIYYRLKQVDTDGKSAYSKVVAVKKAVKNEINIFPNPAQNVVNIITNEALESVKIFNLQGSLLKTSSKSEVEINDIPTGIYIIEVQTSGSELVRKKFLKN